MFYSVYGPYVHGCNYYLFFQTLTYANQESFCIIFMEDVSLFFINNNNNNNNNNNTTLCTVFTINTCNKTCVWGTRFCTYFVVKIHVTCIVMLNVLYLYITSSRTMCAVPNMALFCSSLISCFSSIFPRHFLNYFEIMMSGLVFGLVLLVCNF
jgi:hypothetical protein